MLNTSVIYEYINNIEKNNPAVGVKLKLLSDNKFQLMYITIEKKLASADVCKQAHKRAIDYLNTIEKGLKKEYKSKVGETLSFKMVDEYESHELTGSMWTYGGNESSYFRIFRTYEVKQKNEKGLLEN